MVTACLFAMNNTNINFIKGDKFRVAILQIEELTNIL